MTKNCQICSECTLFIEILGEFRLNVEQRDLECRLNYSQDCLESKFCLKSKKQKFQFPLSKFFRGGGIPVMLKNFQNPRGGGILPIPPP